MSRCSWGISPSPECAKFRKNVQWVQPGYLPLTQVCWVVCKRCSWGISPSPECAWSRGYVCSRMCVYIYMCVYVHIYVYEHMYVYVKKKKQRKSVGAAGVSPPYPSVCTYVCITCMIWMSISVKLNHHHLMSHLPLLTIPSCLILLHHKRNRYRA